MHDRRDGFFRSPRWDLSCHTRIQTSTSLIWLQHCASWPWVLRLAKSGLRRRGTGDHREFYSVDCAEGLASDIERDLMRPGIRAALVQHTATRRTIPMPVTTPSRRCCVTASSRARTHTADEVIGLLRHLLRRLQASLVLPGAGERHQKRNQLPGPFFARRKSRRAGPSPDILRQSGTGDRRRA